MILLGLLNLLLSTGNSLNVDRMEEEGIVNEGVYPEMISPAGDLVDGNTIYPFEHFQRISHSLAPENAFVFRVNCTGIAPSDCQEAK